MVLRHLLEYLDVDLVVLDSFKEIWILLGGIIPEARNVIKLNEALDHFDHLNLDIFPEELVREDLNHKL